jgi:hypothetical protein
MTVSLWPSSARHDRRKATLSCRSTRRQVGDCFGTYYGRSRFRHLDAAGGAARLSIRAFPAPSFRWSSSRDHRRLSPVTQAVSRVVPRRQTRKCVDQKIDCRTYFGAHVTTARIQGKHIDVRQAVFTQNSNELARAKVVANQKRGLPDDAVSGKRRRARCIAVIGVHATVDLKGVEQAERQISIISAEVI